MAYLKKHIISSSITFLFLIISAISFYKFVVKEDYVVAYDGGCNPAYNTCFSVCADDSCIEKIYFSKNRKYKADLYKECGADITNCEAANSCMPNDRDCSITYCSNETIDIANNETCSNSNDLIKTNN